MLARLLSRRSLSILLVLNIAASIVHYLDNIAFFSEYPEPTWLDPTRVDVAWFVMTPFACAGYALYRRGQIRLGASLLTIYALMGLLVLGHYRYADICSIALRIHGFILLEAGAAACLLAWLMLMLRQPKFPNVGGIA